MQTLRELVRWSIPCLCAALWTSCGGGDDGTTEPPPPPALAALALQAPDSITAGQPFALRVEARTAAGLLDAQWDGAVTLTSSAGQIAPSSVQVTNGVANTQATLSNAAGTVTFTASAGTVQATTVLTALSGEPVARLEVVPAGLLLTGAGESQQLGIRALDSQGHLTTATVTWESSAPGTVSVSSAGRATAAAATGSAQLTARAGTIQSPPVVAVVSAVPSGAQLVSDAQVIGPITAVDPAAPYRPGWQYRVRLRGVAATPGQLLLASGATPLAGRVVSVTPVGGDADVVLELRPLAEMVPDLKVNESIPVTRPSASAFAGGPDVAGLTVPPFDRAPWKCTGEVLVPVSVFPLATSATSYDVIPSLTYELSIGGAGPNKVLVTGGVTAQVSVKPRMTLGLRGKSECKVTFPGGLTVPLPGILGAFFALNIPIGVGFNLVALLDFGDIGYDVTVSAGASVTMGVDCTGGCHPVIDVTGNASGEFTPVIPSIANDYTSELSVSGFGWAKMNLGSPLSELLQFTAFEIQLGARQEAKLANPAVQANDASYASELSTVGFLKGEPSGGLDSLARLLDVQLTDVRFEGTLPLATSPKGTIQISPASVRAKTSSYYGDTATVTVSLNPFTYFGAYAVDRVEIYRRDPGSGTPFTLLSTSTDCQQIMPVGSQQAFTCKQVFSDADIGTQTLYAFVKPRILGIALPVLLEIGPNAKADVQVVAPAVSVAVNPSSASVGPGGTRQFSAMVTGATNTDVTWTATGGTITQGGLFTAGNTLGTFQVKATSQADPTKSATAQVLIAPPSVISQFHVGGDVVVSSKRSRPNFEDCGHSPQLPGTIPSALAGAIAPITCTSESDPAGFSATVTGEQDYSATSNTSIPLTVNANGKMTASINSDGNWGLQAYGSSVMQVQFRVNGGNVKLEITGTIEGIMLDPTANVQAYVYCDAGKSESGSDWEAGRPDARGPWLSTQQQFNYSTILTPEDYSVGCGAYIYVSENNSALPTPVNVNGSARFNFTLRLLPP